MSGWTGLLRKLGWKKEREIPDFLTERRNVQTELPVGMHFVTPRVLVMPYPSEDCGSGLATYLNSIYQKQYMIFNLSERTYNARPFHGQVIDHCFSGLPTPPLETLFSVCMSIKAWLSTDLAHVAVMHCQAGLARSLLVLSLFLVWTSPEFTDIRKALLRLKGLFGCPEAEFTPSQARYFAYTEEVLNSPPAMIRIRIDRITFTGIPSPGLHPYIQIFEGRKLVYSSAGEGRPALIRPEDQSCQFHPGVFVQGDVLLRCRNMQEDNSAVTLFRCMFHTSFTSEGVLRLGKSELDGLCNDEKFESDVWVDVCLSGLEAMEWEFWASFRQAKPKPQRRQPEPKPESQPATEEEEDEEEKMDDETLARYQHALDEETPSSDLLI